MRILFVSAYRPNDMSFGAGQRTTFLHNALKSVGSVTTLILREGDSLACKLNPYDEVLAEITYPARGMLQKYAPVPEIEASLRAILDLDSFDLVVGRYLAPICALPPFRGRAIVDADDAYYRYPVGGPPLLGPLLAKVKTTARLWVTQRALSRADHVWFCCQRDQQHFALKSASVLPNVVVLPPLTSAPMADNGVVLFVGALWYQPNRDAVESFLASCWPQIRQACPAATLKLVGAAAPALRAKWASAPGVEAPGFVDDLALEYQRATLTLALIQAGGGTQIKVLESLAHGRVPLVSSFAAGAFAPDLKHGESIYVADDSSAVINQVVELLNHPRAAERVAQAGRQVVARQFSPERFQQAVLASIQSM